MNSKNERSNRRTHELFKSNAPTGGEGTPKSGVSEPEDYKYASQLSKGSYRGSYREEVEGEHEGQSSWKRGEKRRKGNKKVRIDESRNQEAFYDAKG